MDQLQTQRQPITIQLPEGTWVLKEPTLGVYLQAAGRVAAKLGAPPDQVSAEARALAEVVALIELCTLSGPPGWDWAEQPDDRVLMQVWQQWQQGRHAFKSGVGGAEAAGGAA